MGYGYKRAELREDDRLYIVDAQSAVHGDTTDAAEFWPAMIIDGVRVVDENSGWDALNPRVSIGQSDRGEIDVDKRQVVYLNTLILRCGVSTVKR